MKIPIFPGKYHQNGAFSMAMLVYREGSWSQIKKKTLQQSWLSEFLKNMLGTKHFPSLIPCIFTMGQHNGTHIFGVQRLLDMYGRMVLVFLSDCVICPASRAVFRLVNFSPPFCCHINGHHTKWAPSAVISRVTVVYNSTNMRVK